MKAKLTYPALIIAALVVAYANSLTNGFAWLDQLEILDKKLLVLNISDLKQILFFDDNNYSGYHRPLYNLIHTMDYFIWNENAFGFHLSSLLIHVVNVLLIYKIALNFSKKKMTAIFIALSFGLLPCHTATVSLIHSKADLLACFFILLPVYLYSRTGIQLKKSISITQLILWCVLFLLALFSKEVAIMFPIFIIGLSFVLAKQKHSIPNSLLLFPGLLGILFIIFRISTTNSVVDADALGFTDRILSMIPVYVDYIVRTLTSYELTTNDAIRIWSHMSGGTYALYVVAFIIILVAQYYFSRKNDVIAAGFLWYNLFLIPVAQIIPILHFRADRYLYLPSIGFVLALAYIFLYYYERLNWQRHRRILIYGFGFILLISSLRIWNRNKDFASTKEMFSKLILTHPECREAQGFIGDEYLKKGDYQNALLHINKALQKQTGYYSYVDKKSNSGNLGVIYMQQNKLGEALDIFKRLKSVDNYNPEVNFNLGICYKKLKNYKEAKSHLEQYLKYNPDNVDALFNLGTIGIELNDRQMMKKYFSRYLELNPSSEYRQMVENLLQSIEN